MKNIKIGQWERQGDIYIMRVDPHEVPNTHQIKNEPLIIGYGETTNHRHEVDTLKSNVQWLVSAVEDINNFAKTGDSEADIYIQSDGDFDVKIEGGTKADRQRHDAHSFPAGTYKIWRQRQYTPQEVKRVVD